MPGRVRAVVAVVGAVSVAIAFAVSGVSHAVPYVLVALVGTGLSIGYSVRLDGGSLWVRRFAVAKEIPSASISSVERYRYGNVAHLRLRNRDGRRVASISSHYINDSAADHLRRWLGRPDVYWGPGAWDLVAPTDSENAVAAAQGLEPPVGPTRTLSYLAWKVSTAVLYVFAVLAALCLLAGITIWALTFASPSIVMPDWIFAPFFAFAIIGNFVVVLLMVHAHGSKSAQDLFHFRHPPVWLVASAAVVGVLFFLSGPAQLFKNLPGQPGYNASTHQYYFNDHGSLIPTTRAHYLSGVADQTRGFISFAIIFTGIMAFIAGAELARRKRVQVSRLSEIRTRRPRPGLCLPIWAGAGVVLIGVVLAVVPFSRIVERVDAYASHAPAVTTQGTTEYLGAGPWVVFVWCETHATDAPYGCASMDPSDIVIRDADTSAVVQTAVDPSSDHISPDGLPAAGQLTFSIEQPGTYTLTLARPVPKGVFVAPSPGSIAWSLAPEIVLTALGIAVLAGGVVLLAIRVHWLVRDAPPVVVPV